MLPRPQYIFAALGIVSVALSIAYFAVVKRHKFAGDSAAVANRSPVATSPDKLQFAVAPNMPERSIAANKEVAQEKAPKEIAVKPAEKESNPARLKGAERLIAAYPDDLMGIEGNAIRWKDGTLMPYDDGIRAKTIDQRFNHPSLYDQMAMHYTKGPDFPRKRGLDPGRIRYEPFFRKMYGSSRKEVRSKLKSIRWLPKSLNIRLKVTSVNGVHKKLKAISSEIEKLPQSLHAYVANPETYNWRPIAGTRRLSTHSFGIAIDFNTAQAEYWLSDNPRRKGKFAPMRTMPPEIIAIFEKHGFIWGGKWYHYDTMHFEYRPELL